MKNRLAVFVSLCALSVLGMAALGLPALPGYKFTFPQDYFDHPRFDTEWWYYTGNLKTQDGHEFGFELTFFRQATGVRPDAAVAPAWQIDQLYLAHLALSDLTGREFYHAEQLNRSGPGLAGIDFTQRRIWNRNWQVRWLSDSTNLQQLNAVTEKVNLQLRLRPEKPVVVHGHNGISRKGPASDQASHYLSFTRIDATGTIDWQGKRFPVQGLAWMDHEFFSEQKHPDTVGWDWFSVQLENHEEWMFYRLRGPQGEVSPFSSGTSVDSTGHSQFLPGSAFTLTPLAYWTSPATHSRYPIEWNIRVLARELSLHVTTVLPNQQLISKNGIGPDYWEGAVRYEGAERGKPLRGVGYLELTGY